MKQILILLSLLILTACASSSAIITYAWKADVVAMSKQSNTDALLVASGINKTDNTREMPEKFIDAFPSWTSCTKTNWYAENHSSHVELNWSQQRELIENTPVSLPAGNKSRHKKSIQGVMS